jgi:predicted amidohydrolase YtcJ
VALFDLAPFGLLPPCARGRRWAKGGPRRWGRPLTALILRRAQVIGQGRSDLRIEADRITALGPALRRLPGDDELDLGGGAVLPGLHDHHLHILALAEAGRSLEVGPPRVRDLGTLAAVLAAAAADRRPGEWIRAVGYHQSVAGDLDRDVLDRLVPDHPVRVQHRSGVLWVGNSAALAALDAAAESAPGVERDESGRLTGRLWRMDGWLRQRLGPSVPYDPRQLGRVSALAAARGVTGWTDATPERADRDTRTLIEAAVSGAVRQRLHLMMPTSPAATGPETDWPETDWPETDWPETDWPETDWQGGRVTGGPAKILLDDTTLPTLDDLVAVIARVHGQGRAVAVHCVTRVQLVLTLAALDDAGALMGDRIEHGALVPLESLPTLARLGLMVVTQPNFVAERGEEYLGEVPATDLPDLWRGRSLVAAGVKVAAGTDAPFGSLDPWVAVRAAVRRRTAAGRLLGAGEAVDAATALRWWWGSGPDPARPRRLAVGQPADLVGLAAPLPEALSGDEEVAVTTTIAAGEIIFRPGD